MPQQPPGMMMTRMPRLPTRVRPACSSKEPDGLALLPEELCIAIATFLPTADALRARLASRAFWPVFYSQQFWASRFVPSTPLSIADRAWFFEAHHAQPPHGDWRWLYRRTSDASLRGSLRNRQRILTLPWNELPPTLPDVWSSNASALDAERSVRAHGIICHAARDEDHDIHLGCRLFQTRSIAIPDTLASLSVHTVSSNQGTEIVGMSFATAAGDTIFLGSSNPCSKSSVKLTQLWGFSVAVGTRGLRALQCITGAAAESVTPWLGSPDDVPRTERLVRRDRVVGLDVGFDAYKIVSLTVHTQSPDPCQQHQRDLRESAIWYPTIPPRQLYLNEESFPSSDWYKVGYKPLFWCHFGGPGGKYLPHLTGLAFVAGVGINRIRFSFDVGEEDVPLAHRSFGRLKGNKEYDSTIECSIDGPGGERIEGITTIHRYQKYGAFDEQGYMIECNIYTNRGRSCCIYQDRGAGPALADIKETKSTFGSPGVTITGLYAAQNHDQPKYIAAMGVITEELGLEVEGEAV
ncbi:hypothetical protein B0J18DRAFT_457717 [Chaetomium sp. MPI-SDFR-AT-0129]|nr:hypothetical protein B0J18DRAFT_457717 [Chaetomium sp. MPI-SDFR-AT-0129]